MNNTRKENVDVMVTSNFVITDDAFIAGLKKVAGGIQEDYHSRMEASAKGIGSLMEHISGQHGGQPWIKGALDDGTEILLAKSGDSTAYAIPQKELSENTKEVLKNAKVDLKSKNNREVLLVFSTNELDYALSWGTTWAFVGEMTEQALSEMAPIVLAGIVTAGITSIFKRIVGLGADQAAAGVDNFNPTLQETQNGMQNAAPDNVIIRFTQNHPHLARFIGYAAVAIVFFIVFYTLMLVIDNVLLQRYHSHVMVYNVTDQDLKLTIPYTYNAAKRTQPPPQLSDETEILLGKIKKPSDFGDAGSAIDSSKKYSISIANIQIENNNHFFEGLGWVIKLEDTSGKAFKNTVGIQTIPRFFETVIAARFNDMRNGEEIYRDNSDKKTEGHVVQKHSKYTASLSSKEKPSGDGYHYYCTYTVLDTEKYEV